MKKILILMFCAFMVVFCAFSVSADEADDVTNSTPLLDETLEEFPVLDDGVITEEEIKETGEEIYNTLFTRIFEFVEWNRDSIIMVVGFIGTLLITITDIKRKKNVDKGMSESQNALIQGVNGVTLSQNGVVDVVNRLIDRYEEMNRKYTEYENVEDDRNKLMGAVLIQTAAILDILSSAYTGAALPQGIKDIIQLKYARCQTAIDNDEKLRACVAVVRNFLSETEEPNSNSEDA